MSAVWSRYCHPVLPACVRDADTGKSQCKSQHTPLPLDVTCTINNHYHILTCYNSFTFGSAKLPTPQRRPSKIGKNRMRLSIPCRYWSGWMNFTPPIFVVVLILRKSNISHSWRETISSKLSCPESRDRLGLQRKLAGVPICSNNNIEILTVAACRPSPNS